MKTACKFCGATFKQAEDENYSPYYEHLEECRKQKVVLEEQNVWLSVTPVEEKANEHEHGKLETDPVETETSEVH